MGIFIVDLRVSDRMGSELCGHDIAELSIKMHRVALIDKAVIGDELK